VNFGALHDFYEIDYNRRMNTKINSSVSSQQTTLDCASWIDASVEAIRKQVGDRGGGGGSGGEGGAVICGLSGGVDSSVLAALLHKAIGNQLKCIFVDHGLLRKNERNTVEATFKNHFKIDLRVVDASWQFLTLLEGVTDPQEKRKVIGKTFIDVFKAEADKIKGAKFLAQGTIYPDVIESGDGPAGQNVKLHHNVGGLPEQLGFELVEPFRYLYKNDVRKIGEALGLPEQIVWRHPFPGPGLGVRCVGEITEEKLAILREADAIFLEEIIAADLYRQAAQAFAAILPAKAVGTIGEARCYQYAISLRSVDTGDFMTAEWSRIPHEVLAKASTRIMSEVRGVSRVLYDITSKPPGTIEWE